MRLQNLVVCFLNVIAHNMFSLFLEEFDQIESTKQESAKHSDTTYFSPDFDSRGF